MKGILKTLVLTAIPICLIGLASCGQNLQTSLGQNSANSPDQIANAPQEPATVESNPVTEVSFEANASEILVSAGIPKEEVAAILNDNNDDIEGVVNPDGDAPMVNQWKCLTLGNSTYCYDEWGHLVFDREPMCVAGAPLGLFSGDWTNISCFYGAGGSRTCW